MSDRLKEFREYEPGALPGRTKELLGLVASLEDLDREDANEPS
jgi:hypothetical protein